MEKYSIGSLQSTKDGQEFFLNVFLDNPLQKPSFIYLNVLEQALRYNIQGYALSLNYWDEEGKCKTRELEINLKDLLKTSPEVAAFAKDYFPHQIL